MLEERKKGCMRLCRLAAPSAETRMSACMQRGRRWELAFFIQLGFLGGFLVLVGGAVLLRRKLARGPAAAASDGGETKDPA